MAAPSPGPAPRQARGPSLPFPQSSAWLLPQFPPLYAELPRVGVRGIQVVPEEAELLRISLRHGKVGGNTVLEEAVDSGPHF